MSLHASTRITSTTTIASNDGTAPVTIHREARNREHRDRDLWPPVSISKPQQRGHGSRAGFAGAIAGRHWRAVGAPSLFTVTVRRERIGLSAFPPARPARYSGAVAPASTTYQPRATDQGVLHTVIRQHLETFLAEAARGTAGASLPAFVEQEFRDFLTQAARLVDEILPRVPVRQWVLSLPYRLRYLLAWNHALCRAVLRAG